MTRPSSHRMVDPLRHCGNCHFSRYVRVTGSLLCMLGDIAFLKKHGAGDCVRLSLECIEHITSEDCANISDGRIVEATIHVCDEWKACT